MSDGHEQKPSLAFTFQKKKAVQKVAVNVEERKDTGQLISGFDGAKAQIVGGDSAEGKTFVIPKLENTFKTGVGPKKFTPTFKPPSGDSVSVKDGEDKFVQVESTVPVITEYGLQLRDVKPEDRAQAAAAGSSGRGTTAAVLEERALKEELEDLPDVADEEAYEAMPVEEFGRAMLRGMGWEEGMGVGRNRRKVDAIEYVRRPERLGLGAQPVKLGEDPNKPVKLGDKPRKQDLVLAPDADGRQRHIRTLDEKLVPRTAVVPGPQPGKAMRIVAGPHAGLVCTALEALPKVEGRPERWRVRLAASHEAVDLLVSELGERWEKEPTPPTAAAAATGPSRPAAGAGNGKSSSRADERARGRSLEGEQEEERERTEQAGASGRRGGEEPGPSPRRRNYDEAPGRRGDAEGADLRGGDRGRHDTDQNRGRDRYGDLDRRIERDRDRDGDGGGQDGDKRGRQHRGDRRPGGEDDDGRVSKKARGGLDRDRDGAAEGSGRRRDDYDVDTYNVEKKGDRHGKKEKKKHHKDDKKEKKDKHDKHDKKQHKRGRESSSDGDSSDDDDDGAEEGQQRRSGPTWLFPLIKVRILDKRARGGKLYLKKGTVVDVHPGATADVAVDDTGDVLRLPETALETVVPKHEGAAVLVVAGRHRGQRGRLLQASTTAGAAAVQLVADFSIVRLLLDDVAGYTGEMEED